MKKNIAILIISLLSIISCQKKETIFSTKMIDKLSEGNYRSTSIYGYIPVYVLTDKNEIIETNSANLSYVYERHYLNSFNKFNLFLNKALNHKIKIPKINFAEVPYESFVIDNKIDKLYKDNRFNVFLKYFLKIPRSKNGRYLLKTEKLDKNQIKSVSYFLYVNGYNVRVNDARGELYVVTREELFR